MRILVVGSGGREHALVWKLSESPLVEKIYALPGNPGMGKLAELVEIDSAKLPEVADFAEQNKIDLTVIGPEIALEAGIVDLFKKRGLKIFGPTQKAAELESSKVFAKDLMQKYNIPTAFYQVCSDLETAKAYIKEKGAPIVIKADGLAAGKGVVVAMTLSEALTAVDSIMGDKQFGQAGARIVIEEYLEGEEVSILAFCDGQTVVPMLAAQDHKRVFDGDQGPNTGGMGTYAPAPIVSRSIQEEAFRKVLQPVIQAMQKEGRTYKGCLYAGLIVTKEGIKVIEFNCRFGDPETQVVLPLLQSDLAEIFLACTESRLAEQEIKWHPGAAVCVVLASGGYPGNYETGYEITGLEQAKKMSDVNIFHAGTRLKEKKLVTAGGRVLGVTALGKDIKEAQEKAYQAVEQISFAKMHYRHDIAWRARKK